MGSGLTMKVTPNEFAVFKICFAPFSTPSFTVTGLLSPGDPLPYLMNLIASLACSIIVNSPSFMVPGGV